MKGLCACKGCPTRPEGVQVWWKPTQVASILTEVKVSSWILLVLGPRSPKDPTSYEKELFFSSRPSWFLGRGLTVITIQLLILKLMTSYRYTDPTIPQCLVSIIFVLQTLIDFSRAKHCFLLIKSRVQLSCPDIIMYMYYCIDMALSSVGLIISCSRGIVENKL